MGFEHQLSSNEAITKQQCLVNRGYCTMHMFAKLTDFCRDSKSSAAVVVI